MRKNIAKTDRRTRLELGEINRVPELAPLPIAGMMGGAVAMQNLKDTLRALVRLSFDGRVHKTYRGPKAEERFDNETRILRFLEAQACPFVPKLLAADREKLTIVTSSCGSRVEQLNEARRVELFAELEQYGVRHDDPEMRNVTYRQQDGRFCIIDFEFAEILPGFEPAPDESATG